MPLTLVKFIEAGGVAEGADGSRLPAAPTLHPHSGTALAEAVCDMARGFRMQKKGKRKQAEMKASQCPSPAAARRPQRRTYCSTLPITNACHMLSAEHSNHQTTLLPACTTEPGLTPSLPETGSILPKKKGGKRQTRSAGVLPRGGVAGDASGAMLLDIHPENQKDALLGGKKVFGGLSL